MWVSNDRSEKRERNEYFPAIVAAVQNTVRVVRLWGYFLNERRRQWGNVEILRGIYMCIGCVPQ